MGHPEREPQHIPERRRDDCHERIDVFPGMHNSFREMPVYARNSCTTVDCLPPIALEQLPVFESQFGRAGRNQVLPGRGQFGGMNEIGALVSSFRDGLSAMTMAGGDFLGMTLRPGHLGHMGHAWQHRPHHGMPAELLDIATMGSRMMSPAVIELGRQIMRRPMYDVGPGCYNVGFRQPREECHERFRWGGGYNHNGFRPPHREYHPAVPRTPGGHNTTTTPVGHGPGGLPG